MKRRFPKLTAFAIGFIAAFLSLVAGFEAASAVGDATHSGPFGICGPYGPHAELVAVMFLGSFLVSMVVGVGVARFVNRYFARGGRNG